MTSVNLATAEEFYAEIARLQAEIDRLRSQPCPYVTGNVTKRCTLTPFTLTAAEREAVEWAVSAAENCQHPADDALRGLLARLA